MALVPAPEKELQTQNNLNDDENGEAETLM